MLTEVLTLAQLYRDQADSENPFDELKNQWGWAGLTTRELPRCRTMAGFIALVYTGREVYQGPPRYRRRPTRRELHGPEHCSLGCKDAASGFRRCHGECDRSSSRALDRSKLSEVVLEVSQAAPGGG